MKHRLLLIAMVIFSSWSALHSQEKDVVYINSTWKMGHLYRMAPNGIPDWGAGQHEIAHPHGVMGDETAPPDTPENAFGLNHFSDNKTAGTTVQVGRNFEGNHLYDFSPSDNAIAISDGGIIVSIDNATVAYFKDNGDSTVKYGLPHASWYQDTTMIASPFDPRVIYDREQRRFIAVMMYHSPDYSESRILVSFSQPLVADSVSWNHYQISMDSIYNEQGQDQFWADFPSIAINKNELYIAYGVYNRDTIAGTNSLVQTGLLQIEKAQGYAGAGQLNCKEWLDIKNADGVTDGALVPVGEAFQSPSYGPGCLLMSNYAGNSTKFFWYDLTGGINDANAMLISRLTATSFFYSFPSFATQMGGNGGDRIRVGVCNIQSGFVQHEKIHFVFHRSDNGWGEVVYANIDTTTNTFFADTWGGDEESLNSLYPSIAPYGKDSSEENFMIAYLRSGPTIFPEICVINYDGAWSLSETVVKQGEGILDQSSDLVAPWDSLERIGDYIDIQRRYNDPHHACWLAGGYAAGPLANHFGTIDGIKTWIAEVGDSMLVSRPEPSSPGIFSLFPNPNIGVGEVLNIHLPVKQDAGDISILNNQGVTMWNKKFSGSTFSVDIPSLPSGIYFVLINSNKYSYATKKLIIRR